LNTQPIQCSGCDVIFSTKDALAKHVRQKRCKGKPNSVASNNVENDEQENETEEEHEIDASQTPPVEPVHVPASVSTQTAASVPTQTAASVPTQTAAVSQHARRVITETDLLVEEFVKIAAITHMEKNEDRSCAILRTILMAKCVEKKVNLVGVSKIHDLLTNEINYHNVHWALDRMALQKKFMRYNFSHEQSKLIDALHHIELSDENLEKELAFAEYYGSYVKLMGKYHLASNKRGKSATKNVLNALASFKYSSTGEIVHSFVLFDFFHAFDRTNGMLIMLLTVMCFALVQMIVVYFWL